MYPIGTRISKSFDGEMYDGKVTMYSPESGFYTIEYEDGDHEDMTDALVKKHLLKPVSEVAGDGASGESSLVDGGAPTQTEIDALLGTTVAKVVRSYEGKEEFYSGSIAAYFQETEKFRVYYCNGLCEDMTFLDLKLFLESQQNRKRTASDDIGDDFVPLKKPRTEEETSSKAPPPLRETKLPTRSSAYVIIRRVLSAILVQNAVKSFRTEKQVAFLNNKDMNVSLTCALE